MAYGSDAFAITVMTNMTIRRIIRRAMMKEACRFHRNQEGKDDDDAAHRPACSVEVEVEEKGPTAMPTTKLIFARLRPRLSPAIASQRDSLQRWIVKPSWFSPAHNIMVMAHGTWHASWQE